MDFKKVSKKQEQSVAEDVGGRTTLGSGCLWFQKADVRNGKYLFECKTTQLPYYNFNIKLWDKINKEAIKDGLRTPAFVIDYSSMDKRVIILNRADLIVKANDKKINLGEYNKSFKIYYKNLIQRIFEDLEYISPEDLIYFTFTLDNRELVLLEWVGFLKMEGFKNGIKSYI